MTELSRLETLLDAVAGDPDRAAAFYDALLSSKLYVPVTGTEPVLADSAPRAEKLDLMAVRTESGRLFTPVFETADRALAYAADATRDTGDTTARTYAELHGRDLIRLLDPEIAVIFNPGGERIKVFERDELQYLRAELRRIERDKRRSKTGSRKLAFHSVIDLPAEMARDLDQACAAHPAVHAVYILEIEDAARAHGKRYLILLDIDAEESDQVFKAAGEAIGGALAGHFMRDTYLEVASFEQEEAYASAITQKNVAPVWSRGASG